MFKKKSIAPKSKNIIILLFAWFRISREWLIDIQLFTNKKQLLVFAQYLAYVYGIFDIIFFAEKRKKRN
jgi:hypothetical protein